LFFIFATFLFLDGFDFGVGALFATREDADEREQLLSAIGPFWDGNEVWLVVFGGAMFAGLSGRLREPVQPPLPAHVRHSGRAHRSRPSPPRCTNSATTRRGSGGGAGRSSPAAPHGPVLSGDVHGELAARRDDDRHAPDSSSVWPSSR